MVGEALGAIGATLITGGAGLTAIIGYIRWLLERRDRRVAEAELEEPERQSERLPQMFAAFGRLYDTLRVPVHEHGATRAMLLKAADSGHVPRVGVPLYATVVAELTAEDAVGFRSRWTQRPVDDWYIHMLMDLVVNQEVQILTDDIPEGAVLKDSSIIGSVTCSHVYLVAQMDTEMYYLMMTFEDKIPTTPHYREDMRSAITTIRAILKEEVDAVGVIDGSK